ncbi:15-cis-zeta-carotene isomerase, chloroplastic-like isoform X2 [Hibiscus syriacus]|uniref:15-cis-zeta-carotene isomerase, chloroplastic-like isoform X2 n=1 Tax=Hibiscus syriacus TaxID=106335 RepID=UPI0019230C8A|nr:15-cis-zeta-carotene isomerase, chloroplastic-like isoform X2 [Hibiscus syriacus]
MAACLVVANSSFSSPRPVKPIAKKHHLQLISSLSLFHLKPRKPINSTSLKPHSDSFRIRFLSKASLGETDSSSEDPLPLVGEDSAAFDLGTQSIVSWIYFTLVLGIVLFILDVVWIDNSTGYGKAFIDAVSTLSDSHEVVMLALILIFATVHSGLASFRDTGEKLLGKRPYRVLFAGVSLPLVVSTVVYFINHRYDGLQLWQLQNAPGVHQLVWLLNFVSFIFLYPSTFNLLEVAAVDKPEMHLWETGIMRITRHPQVHHYYLDGRAGNLVLGTHTLDWKLCSGCSLHWFDRTSFIWCLEW